MSVLIKGMEMPKDCNSCRFSGFGDLRNERIVCMLTGSNDYLNQQERFPDCPLVEVPSHGRLIDADALIGKLHDECLFDYDARSVVYADIQDAPTIMKAEEADA